VTIKLVSEPRGADVYRLPQAVRIGTTPLAYPIDASDGEVVLIVKKSGYVDRQLVVPADRDTEQTITLARVTKPREAKPPVPDAGSASTKPDGGTLDPFDKLSEKPGRKR
jgi:hypothetical protein